MLMTNKIESVDTGSFFNYSLKLRQSLLMKAKKVKVPNFFLKPP